MHCSIKQRSFAEIFLIFSLLLIGLFYESLSCIASVIMLVWLIIKIIKNKEFKFKVNLTGISLAVLVLSYLLTSFWAVDYGMAVIGFMKFLPVLLFFLILQLESKDDIIQVLPYVGIAITIISSIGMQFSATKSFFSVDGRLAGFFQYANTFAIFLLVSQLLILSKKKYKVLDYVALVILVFGILYTGSRTTFVLFVLSNIVLIFSKRQKKFTIFTIIVIGAAIVAAVAYFLLKGDISAFNRFLTISLTNSSTFLGRLLYFYDALPIILKHPFGLGYMGYYYLQHSVQTGVYTVMFIHNDFLQILLDVGWLPCGLFIAAIIKSVFSKKTPSYKKIILCTMLIHSCFDFDLQFIAMFFVLILLMDYNSGKEISIKKGKAMICAVSAVLIALCVYFAAAMGFYQLGKTEIAHKLYPINTQNEIIRLTNENDINKAKEIADDIFKRNEYVTSAYSAKARYAYSQGDFEKVISYKKQLFEKSPFAYYEYEEYCYMLMNGITLYHQAGDFYSENVCREELIAAKQAIRSNPDNLSKLGKKISVQPSTVLPQDIEDYIANIENTYTQYSSYVK